MKLRILSTARLSFPLASALAALLAVPSLHAVNGNWNVDAAGNWSTAASWSSTPTVPGTVAGDVIGLNNNIGAARTVTIDTTGRTAGTLNIGDSNNTHVFTLAASGGGTLTFNNSGSGAQINETGSQIDVISAPIVLADNLAVSAAGSVTFSTGGISETGGARTLTKSGAGLLTLSAANSYTGLTTVSAGVLNIQNATALGGVAGGTTVASGAVLQIQNIITVGAEALSLSGEGIAATTTSLSGTGISTSGALRNISGNNTYGGAITLASASRINSDTFATTLTLTGGITATNLNLAIGGLGNTTVSTAGITTGSGSLTKDNIGTLTLSAANTYTGTTTVLGGTLAIAREAALYNGVTGSWTAANINVKGGATLALTVDPAGTLGFTEANLSTLLTNISVANTAAQGLQAGASVGIDTTNAGGSFTPTSAFANSTGAFGGVTGLTKLGTGNLVLDLANTYTGPTAVSAGTLQLGSGGTGGTLSTSSPITVASGAAFAINRSDTVTQGTDFNAAPITGAGGFTQAGAGITVLTAANTFTGTTTVSSGVLQLDNALALQNSALSTSGTGTVTLGAGVTVPAFGGVSGTTNLATVLPSYSSLTNLILNPQSGSTPAYSGIIADGAVGMILTKSGAGTQVLSGVSTYTGATIINAGALNLSTTGSIAASTGLTLNNGALTLTNTNTIEGAIDRVSNSAGITSNGGTINYTNTSSALESYAETLGAVDLVRGQLAINLTNVQLGGQILTLADLTRTGSSNTSTLSLTGGPNTTTSQLLVTSKVGSATPAGQIVGPWFNTNAAGQVVGSGTAPSTELAWTDPASAYTVRTAVGGASGAAAAERLTTTRNMTGLRIDTFSSGAAATLAGTFFTRVGNTLANGDPVTFAGVPTGFTANVPYYVINVGGNGANTFQVSTTPGGSAATFTAVGTPSIVPGILLATGANLGTTGILQQSGVTTVIAPGTGGVVTLPSTTPDNLYINTGGSILTTGNLNVLAPIADNGAGVLTLVKSGVSTLTLSGTNTYTGGTVLNAGTVAINNASSFGVSAGAVTVNGDSRINATGGVTYANAIAVNSGTTLTLQNPATGSSSTAEFTGVLSGSGNLFLPNSGANAIQGILAFTSTANTFTGNVVLSASGSGDEHFKFNSLGDGGNFTIAKNGNRQLITYTGSTDITFNTRQIVVAATMFGTTDRQGMDGGGGNPVNIFQNDGTGTITFTKDMVVNNLTSHYGVLYFGGTNTGDNTLSGNISDTSGSSKFAIGKFGPGKWVLSGTNTYEGNTLIAGGTLAVGTIANSSTPQPLGIGPAVQLGVGNNGVNGTLLYTGGTASTDKQIQIGPVTQANGTAAGSVLNDGTGALAFTNPNFNPTTLGVTGSRTLTLGGSYTGGTNTVQGIIQNNATAGVVAVTKTGAGTWQLSAANTYTGATILTGGTLILSGSNSSAAATTIGTGGGTLQLDSSSNGGLASGSLNLNSATAIIQALNADRSLSNSVVMNGDLGSAPTFSGANSITLTGNLRVNNAAVTLTNNIDSGKVLTINTIDRDGSNSRNLTVEGTGETLVGGAIALSGGSLTKNGAGAMTLSGVNTYTGSTIVSGGSLTLTDNAQLSFVLGATTGVNNSIAGAGTVTLDGDFSINTAAADGLNAGTWILENVDTLAGAYGSSFTVSGFTDIGGDQWEKTLLSGKIYTFDETTGILTLVTPDPFPAWAVSKGLNGTPGFENGKGDDPDGDGFTNLDEFAFDGNPLSGANDGKIVGKIATVGPDQVMTLTLPVRNGATFANDGGDQLSALIDGVYYRVEGSLDLSVFANTVTEVTPAVSAGLPALSSGWSYRSFRAPGTVPTVSRTFLRVKASETP
jgi:autotransporter-associated beta strand protein